jgi:[ribosomal protein S5]-alanine N-acetyltransferase
MCARKLPLTAGTRALPFVHAPVYARRGRMETLYTARLDLVPVTVDLVEAVLDQSSARCHAILEAELPNQWPGRALVERAFYASLEAIRSDPGRRLWGDRVMIARDKRRVVGSVIFHGAPDEDGSVEVAYGVEEDSQGCGFGTEATRASVEWALGQPEVRVVRAATPPWHIASQKVLERCGLVRVGTRDSPLGEVLEYERRLERAR